MKRPLSALLIVLLVLGSFIVLWQIPTAKALDTLITEYAGTSNTNVYTIARVHPSSENSYSALGEAFTMGAQNYFLTQAVFRLVKAVSPTGYVQARLYATTGSPALPTGAALAVSDFLQGTSLNTTFVDRVFNFSAANQYELQASTTYAIVMYGYNATLDSTSYIRVWADASSPTYAGTSVAYKNSAWGEIGGVDISFAIYGIQEKLTSSNEAHTNSENGVETLFSSYWVKTGAINCSGYILSLNYGSGYTNNTWAAFSDVNNVWANVSQVLLGSASQVGNTVYYKTFANASNGVWYESATLSFVLQATVTFAFSNVGKVEKNDVLISNSSVTYTTPTFLKMDALPGSTYSFLNWNWTNSPAASTDNSLNFTVTNQTTLTCWFGAVSSFDFSGNATEGQVLAGYTFYNNSTALRTGTFTAPTPGPGGTGDISTDDAFLYLVLAVVCSMLIFSGLAASKLKKGTKLK